MKKRIFLTALLAIAVTITNAQGRELAAEATTHLVHGQAMGGCGGGGEEVGHGFGLAEVHFAIEESTLGIFARLGKAAAILEKSAHHLL